MSVETNQIQLSIQAIHLKVGRKEIRNELDSMFIGLFFLTNSVFGHFSETSSLDTPTDIDSIVCMLNYDQLTFWIKPIMRLKFQLCGQIGIF